MRSYLSTLCTYENSADGTKYHNRMAHYIMAKEIVEAVSGITMV
jgi:hypothetical protein